MGAKDEETSALLDLVELSLGLARQLRLGEINLMHLKKSASPFPINRCTVMVSYRSCGRGQLCHYD